MDKCRTKKLGFNLKYSKEKNKSEKMNTLVLLDYDDTLIPSTKLQNLLKLLNINKRKKDRQNNENMAPMEINKLSLTQTDEVDIFFDNIPITLHDKNIKEASNSRVSNLVADTSLPTQSNYPFSNDIMLELKQAETAAVLLLKEIYLKGLKMVIISNAEIDWIWYTLNCFFPSLHNIIKSYDIAVVSARDNFEEIYRDKPELWKIACFRQQFQHHFTASFTAPGVDTSSLLVSIGDSLHERFAAQTVGSEVENVNILSIKLLDTPNHDILTKQLRFISSNFGGYLINESNDLFVQVRDDGECYYEDHQSQEKQVSVVTPVSIALDNKHMKSKS